MKKINDISEEEFMNGKKGASFVPMMPQEIMFPSTGGQTMINFEDKNKCPKCKVYLVFQHIVPAVDWPYTHSDVKLRCPKCDDPSLFGIPREPLFGLELIIWDSILEKMVETYLEKLGLKAPVCKFHKTRMKLTKVWGNKVMVDKEEVRAQWKCMHADAPDKLSTCFLTAHKTAQRKGKEHIAKEAAEGLMRERLRKLGYLE